MQNEHDVITSVWDGHEDEEYRRDQSHWRGYGRWADDTAWKNIGVKSIARVASILAFTGHKERLFSEGLNLLEWGPGGGANAYAFRRIARNYYGVDISEKNLQECQRLISSEGVGRFEPVLLTGAPSTIKETVREPVDIFLSTAVFQHFPNKEYGKSVLQAIRSVCTSKSVGFIQIRYDSGKEKYAGNIGIEDYKARHLYANSYKIDEFWALCVACGFEPLYVRDINDRNNYATFYLSAAR